MQGFKPVMVCMAVAMTTAGCGGSDTSAKQEPMAVEDTVVGGQIQQMNRVKAETSKLSGERMDTLNKHLEDQEKGQAQ